MTIQDEVNVVRNGAGWATLPRLSLIRVTGPNRVKFLHGLLSNDIAGLRPGESRLAALMDIKGHQVAWMRVLAEADALVCELPLTVRDEVFDTFVHYKVGAPVRFEKADAVIFGLFGPSGAATLAGFAGVQRVGRGPDLPASGVTLHVESMRALALEEALRSLLGGPVSAPTLETLRVEEGTPWHGIDVTPENLLHETGQLDVYHSSTKGCYLGQEVVARLEGRGGHVNKHLRGLRCSKPASAGEPIESEGKNIGRVTSAGLSPEFGAIAMGFVHRAHADPGTRVTVAGIDAEIAALPFKA